MTRPAYILPALFAMLTTLPLVADDAWRADFTALARLHMERLGVLKSKYATNPYALPYEAQERARAEAAMSALAASAPPPRAPGVRLEAFMSAIDASPQPFWTFSPEKPAARPGLLLFLHGYSPDLDLVTAPGIPAALTNLAERAGAYIAAPFGRGNTDYQGIGEADVLRVLDEMARRHGIDTNRVVLSGSSMGGLGVWCIASRWPALFNAAVPISGRADYYVWHKIRPDDLPQWQREIVDVQFAGRYLPRLANTTIAAAHGALDDIVTYDQGSYPVSVLRGRGAREASLVTFDDLGHDIFGEAITNATIASTILKGLTEDLPRPTPEAAVPAPRFRGESGSRVMDALLSPFAFVAGDSVYGFGYPQEDFSERVAEWVRFAHGAPFAVRETSLTLREASTRNLFLFGEPESSPLIRYCLRHSGASITRSAFVLAGKRLPREGHGLILALPNPFNTNLTAVVQCGLPWGRGTADNHRYDRIPDVISYSDKLDAFGYPFAEAAGFLTPSNTIRWCAPPYAIEAPAVE